MVKRCHSEAHTIDSGDSTSMPLLVNAQHAPVLTREAVEQAGS